MKNNKLLIIFLVIIGAGILFGHSFYHMGGYGKSETRVVKAAPNTVEIRKYEFSPKTLNVKKGTTVTWINYDIAPHTVTIDDANKDGPESKLFKKGEKFTYTFSKTGSFPYHCDPHPYMKATVVVTE